MNAKDILQRCKDAFPHFNVFDAFIMSSTPGNLSHKEQDFVIKGMPSGINKTHNERAAEWEEVFAAM